MKKGKRIEAFMIAVAVAASSLGVTGKISTVQAAENVIEENGFEANTVSPWESKDGATLSVVSESPHAGSYCLKVSERKSTTAGAALKLNGVKENQILKLSVYVKYTAGPETKRIQATLLAGGNYYVMAGGDVQKGEWGEIKGSVLLPEDVDLSDAKLFFETPWMPEPTAENDWMDFYVDDITVSVNSLQDTSDYPSLKELYQDEFYIGVAAPDTVLNQRVYSDLIKQQFNSMTMENEMKPAYILDQQTSQSDLDTYQERTALNFNAYKTGMDYAKKNGIHMRGHVLVWHSQTPDWFFYENYDTSGTLASRELMLKRMENYIKDVICWTETNYPGVIYAWDVVNEAVADYFGAGAAPMRQEDSLWYQTIGEDFVQKAFEYARKYTTMYAPDHKIKLFYNDYNEYFPAKRDGIIEMLKPVKEAGNIDGVGMQSHIDTNQPLEGNMGYITALRKFSDELGVELHVTELDIGIAEGATEEIQGAYYEELMQAILDQKREGVNVTCVTFWGLNDALSWRAGADCLLLRQDLSRKPAFDSVVKVADKLAATKVAEVINSIGEVTFTGQVREQIKTARAAYDKLSDSQKVLVDNYTVLTEAEERYAELKAENDQKEQEEKEKQEAEKKAQADKKAAEGVIALIDQIGTVTKSDSSKAKIEAARAAYNKLTGERKALVTNYKVLTNAEAAYKKLIRTPENPFKQGASYKVDNYVYKITSLKQKKVTVTKAAKSTKTISIGSSVKIKGVSFQITAVGDKAFQKNKKVTSVTLGKNITSIGSNAFSGCSNLTKVAVNSKGLQKIGTKSFYNCKKLKSVKLTSNKLKTVGKQAFKGTAKKIVIDVPNKNVKAYKKKLQKSGLAKTAVIR